MIGKCARTEVVGWVKATFSEMFGRVALINSGLGLVKACGSSLILSVDHRYVGGAVCSVSLSGKLRREGCNLVVISVGTTLKGLLRRRGNDRPPGTGGRGRERKGIDERTGNK